MTEQEPVKDLHLNLTDSLSFHTQIISLCCKGFLFIHIICFRQKHAVFTIELAKRY